MSIEAMRQALEALEIEQGAHAYLQLGKAEHIEEAITALRTAIEQAEKQEPVAWANINKHGDITHTNNKRMPWSKTPLYTTPPEAQKEHKQMNGKQSPAPWNTPATSVQEPVAWQGVYDKTDLYYRKPVQGDVRPLYTTSPAAPVQEPYCYHDGRNIVDKQFASHSDVFPLYTTPSSAQRQPLTEEEVLRLWAGDVSRPVLGKNKVLAFARAIEAAHGIGEKK